MMPLRLGEETFADEGGLLSRRCRADVQGLAAVSHGGQEGIHLSGQDLPTTWCRWFTDGASMQYSRFLHYKGP